jgi:hypothetical protein
MRRLLNLLIGLAFAVRSLLPVGFMLAATPAHAGGVEIVICTGHGLQSLTVDDEGKTAPAKAPMSAKDICPYAPVGAVAVDHDTPHLLTRTVHYASLTYRVTRELFHATPRPGAQSARGPPAVLI